MTTQINHAAAAAPVFGARAVHTRRVRFVVVFCGYSAIVLGLPWMLFFMWQGAWATALTDGLLTALGVIGLRLARRDELRRASLLLVASLIFRLFTMVALFDIPSADVPRSVHYYFIPLAMATYLMFRHDKPWIKHSLAWLSLSSVVFYSNSPWGIATRVMVPDTVRATGNWINSAMAMALLFLLLLIFVLDIEVLERSVAGLRQRWIDCVHRALPRQLIEPLAKWAQRIAPSIPQYGIAIPSAGTEVWQNTQASRTRMMTLVGGTILIGVGLLDAFYFAMKGNAPVMLINLSITALGAALTQMVGDKGRGWTMVAFVLSTIAVILICALLIDIPAPGQQRSVHFWFLPIALAAYFLLRNEGSWIQCGLPLACLVFFTILASSNWSYLTPLALPQDIKPPAWANTLAALGSMYAYVHILVGDVKRTETRFNDTLSRLF